MNDDKKELVLVRLFGVDFPMERENADAFKAALKRAHEAAQRFREAVSKLKMRGEWHD